MRNNLDRTVGVRVVAADEERIERITLRADGMRKSDVLREALRRGLALVEAELDAQDPKRAGGKR